MRAVRWAEGLENLLVPIDSIRQHPENPNNGDVDELITSIQMNGFNTVLTVDKKTGYIIAGNHRWQALHALGATHVPVIWAVDTGNKADLRYMVADNVIGQMAVMDKAATIALLQDLQETEVGLLGTGFDDEGLERMLIEQAAAEQAPVGDGAGFGGPAPNGIWQVVVEFEGENAQHDRDRLFTELDDRFHGQVRTVNL